MPVFGSITVNFDGFIKYLDCEITGRIQAKTKQLQETHTDLQVVLRAMGTEPHNTLLFWCLPINVRNRRTNSAVADLEYIQASSRMEHRINQIQVELQVLTTRREFIHTTEFREKVLGQCPVCFDELVDKSETTIIPDCLHPVCHSCFDKIHHKQQGYKCPMCCDTSNIFYEVWFCTIPDALPS